jgi:lysophospholipase L1-like esterase
MAAAAGELGVAVVFTVVPTKELAFANRVAASGLQAPAAYSELVRREQRNIDAFRASLVNDGGIAYVDVVEPLQHAAMGEVPIYPENENGHPVAAGYRVIAEALAPAVAGRLPIVGGAATVHRNQRGPAAP